MFCELKFPKVTPQVDPGSTVKGAAASKHPHKKDKKDKKNLKNVDGKLANMILNEIVNR